MTEEITYKEAVCAQCGYRSKLKQSVSKVEAYCANHGGTGVFIQIDALKEAQT